MIRAFWRLLRRAWERFDLIDGTQWAGALAYSAFASLFPMMLLFISVASFLIDRNRAGRAVIGFVQSYLPMSEVMKRLIFATIDGMVAARGRAGAAALAVLLWAASQCFSTFVRATNRAWGVSLSEWWRLPLKSLILLGVVAGTAPLSMTASALTRLALRRLSGQGADLLSGVSRFALPMSTEFFALAVFYRFAPRRPTRFAEVWAGAGVATLLLRAAENLFVIYLDEFSASNAVYGVFGGIMALLLWIYLSGCVFIYGACVCAARSEVRPPRAFAVPPQ